MDKRVSIMNFGSTGQLRPVEEEEIDIFEVQVTELVRLHVSSNIDDQLLVDLVDWIVTC